MKCVRNVLFIVCALLILSATQPPVLHADPAAQPPTLSQEQLEAIAIQPASNWGKGAERVVPEMLPLFKEESIQFEGKTIKYRLHVPETLEPGKKYPMILWLHGAGESGDDNKLQLIHLHHIITSLTGEKKRDFFLLVPQYGQNEYWSEDGGGTYRSIVSVLADANLEQRKKELFEQTQAASPPDAHVTITEESPESLGMRVNSTDQRILERFAQQRFLCVTVESPAKGGPLEFAFAMVEKTVKDYPVDADRITVSGLSTGGDGTWRALERRPEMFAAAVPIVSWSPLADAAMEKSPILKKIPIWAIYSSDDHSIDSARREFERVEAAGANVKKTEFGICGHTAWTPAMLQADIFAWLLSRTKKDGTYTAVYDPGVNPDDFKGIIDVAARDSSKPDSVKPALAPAVERPQTQETIQAVPPAQRVFEERMGGPYVLRRRVLPGESQGIQLPSAVPINTEKDNVYIALAQKYFIAAEFGNPSPEDAEERYRDFANSFAKISPKGQLRLLESLTQSVQSAKGMKLLETLLDSVPTGGQPGMPLMQTPLPPRSPREPVPMPPPSAEGKALSAKVEKIIEECNRPWAMTSDSLYGMFPADWNKEAELIPEFVINSTSDDLAKILAKSIGNDPEAADFLAACKSILALQNKPMSSPWFETSGGRLQGEIKYSLSAKGQMFVRFLRTVKESSGNSEKVQALGKAAAKTLEKIDTLLMAE